MLYSHNQNQLYKHIIHRHLHMHAEHSDTMKTSDTVLLEKYISHFIWKDCVWEGVGNRTELQHIDPRSTGHNRVSFPFSWAAQPGDWGPSLSGRCSHSSISPNWSVLLLVWSPTATAQSGAWGPTLLGAAFLYRILSPTGLVSKLTDFLSSLSYIIVQRPLLLFGVTNSTHSTHPRSRL